MKKRYVLAIYLSAALRLSAQPTSNDVKFGASQLITNQVIGVGEIYPVDLDGDGDQDILSASPGDDKIAWYENDGLGNFGDQNIIAIQRRGARRVQAADLDGDGDTDIVAASSKFSGYDEPAENYNNVVVWYENDGQQNFSAQQLIKVSTLVEDVTLAELDDDGDSDILLAIRLKGILWLENQGDGNFEPIQELASLRDADEVFVADMDNDGDQDIVSVATGYLGKEGVFWYRNDGQQNFEEYKISGNTPYGTRVTDLNRDGDLDILIGDLYYPNPYDSDSPGMDLLAFYQNDGQGNFTKQVVDTDGVGSLITGDVDNDGDVDVLANLRSYSNSNFGGLFFYENDGTGSFDRSSLATSQLGNLNTAVFADLDGDGDQDLVTTSLVSIDWYENLAVGTAPITSLTLFDARTNKEVQTLDEGDVIDLLDLTLRDYNIQANVDAEYQITRLTFDLTAPARQDTTTTEFKAPYALYGDRPNGDFRPRRAYDGDYRLTVTPYYLNEVGDEVAGVNKTVNFTFVARGLRARNLRMIDTRDNSLIETLDNGNVITLARDQRISILADSRYPQYNSIEFFLDGPNPDGTDEVRALENLVPYAIFGDDGLNTNPNGNPLAAGEYELRVIPYQGKRRASYAGPEEIVRFTVVRGPSASPVVYPIPLQDEVMVRLPAEEVSSLTLRHAYGQTYSVPTSEIQTSDEGIRVNLRGLNLPAGPYVLQIVQGGEIQHISVTKE